MRNRLALILVLVGAVVSEGVAALAAEGIGTLTAVQPKVTVQHPGQAQPVAVKPGDAVLFQDQYETGPKAKAKLFFVDDSILTLAENSRLAITEAVFDPAAQKKSVIAGFSTGTLRALVGGLMGGKQSKFEIHTPTMVAAARGSYAIIVVKQEGGETVTQLYNLDPKTGWEVKNADPNVKGAVLVTGSRFTTVSGKNPPAPPAVYTPDQIKEHLDETEAKDEHKEELVEETELPGSDVAAEVVGTSIEVADFFADILSQTGLFPFLPPIDQQPGATSTVLVGIFQSQEAVIIADFTRPLTVPVTIGILVP